MWTAYGVAALLSVLSCRAPRAANPPDAIVSPEQVDPEFREAWEEVLRAQAEDPSGSAVAEAADRLLESGPPPELRVAALHAKASQSFAAGQDALAIEFYESALVEAVKVDPPLRDSVRVDLGLARARGGDPQRALADLDGLARDGLLDDRALAGARAVALDRAGDDRALVAFAVWRSTTAAGSADAVYAMDRFQALARHRDADALLDVAETLEGPAATCLAVRAGRAVPDGSPGWVQGCQWLPARVGILLPRSGRLSVLGDDQLAAARVAVQLLSGERAAEVRWVDSGSTPATAVQAAAQLAGEVDVVVGPVGAALANAVADGLADTAVVLPGETVAGLPGAGPTLERRAQALVQNALDHGGAVTLAVPQNAYGRRVKKAVDSALSKLGDKSLKVLEYSQATTSFANVLDPVVRGGDTGALIVGDTTRRTKLIVQQLRRAGRTPMPSGGGLRVLAMAEGLGSDTAALEGVVVAPAAGPTTENQPFRLAFEASEGRAPNDRATLVWEAMARAWHGALATAPVRLWEVRGGSLVQR